jgi:hypothetical protein
MVVHVSEGVGEEVGAFVRLIANGRSSLGPHSHQNVVGFIFNALVSFTKHQLHMGLRQPLEVSGRVLKGP